MQPFQENEKELEHTQLRWETQLTVMKMKIRFRWPESRQHPKPLFVMLSQFGTTTFSMPVRKFRSPKPVGKQTLAHKLESV